VSNFGYNTSTSSNEKPSIAIQIADIFKDRPVLAKSWVTAEEILDKFQITPFSVKRIANLSLGCNDRIFVPPATLFLGHELALKWLQFDEHISAEKDLSTCSDIKSLIDNCGADVVVVCLVIHSICRGLAKQPLRRIWSAMLDDALIRARIGYLVASNRECFGAGRGMLVGLISRIGLAILLATGGQQRATKTLKLLAEGRLVKEATYSCYGCDSLYLSALILLNYGLGQDATLGILSYGSSYFKPVNEYQEDWHDCFIIVEMAKMGVFEKIPETILQRFNLDSARKLGLFRKNVQEIIRNGHKLQWIVS
jgi:hypothetical protein